MSRSSTARSAIEQSDFFDKLDVAFTIILIIAGVLTFPLACFVYLRILTLKRFKGQYLTKLFVLNGASNMLIYLVNMIAVQFSNWPSMFGFHSWMRGTFLRFSLSVMWQTTFFISLIRLISLKNQHLLVKYDLHYFIFASFSSIIISILICTPLFFSNYSYVQVLICPQKVLQLCFCFFFIREGVFVYIPKIPKAYKWTSTPAMVYQLSLAAGTLFVNIIISIVLMRMRKEHSSKMKSRPEQGLLFSSSIAFLLHLIHEALKFASKIFNDDMISYFLTLTIAFSSTLPFWTMIVFAHSMRRAIISDLVSDETRSIVRGRSKIKNSGKKIKTTMSANF